MAELKRARIPMPSGGMNTVAAPGQAPEGKAPVVRNFLPSFPGKMVMRGPILGGLINKSTWSLFTKTKPYFPIGCAVHNDRIILSLMETGGGFVPSWKQPYLRVNNGTPEEFSRPTVAVFINTTTGEFKSVGGSNQLYPGNSYAKLEGNTYYVAAWQENTKVGNDLYGSRQSLRYMFKWNGSLQNLEQMNAAPQGVQYLKSYLNRIWALGGVEAGIPGGVKWKVFPGSVNVVAGNAFFIARGTRQDMEEYFEVSAGVKKIGGSGPTVTGIPIVVGSEAAEEWKIQTIGTFPVTFSGVGTMEVSTLGFEPNALFFSDAGGPTANESAKWKDDVTGLINRIIIGDDDQQDFGVGLAVVGQVMLILKRKSVWALYGTSPETFQVRNLTYEFGCIDPNSILESNYGVFFASQRGLMFFNGEQFEQVDSEIENTTVPLMDEVAGTGFAQEYNTYFGAIHVEDINNGYLMMTITKQALATGAIVNSFCGIMDYDSGNWSEITAGTGGLKGAGVPLWMAKTKQNPFVFDGDFITDIVSLASITTGAERNIDKAHEPFTAIPAKVQTDRIALGSPGYVSQLHRIMQDYTFPNGANDAAAAAGWWWSLTDGDGTVIQEPVQLPGTGLTATNYLRGRRWEEDNFNEIIDGQLTIEWKSSTLEIRNPELYDATFEFTVTRQRRKT